jgi:hypothetical protein
MKCQKVQLAFKISGMGNEPETFVRPPSRNDVTRLSLVADIGAIPSSVNGHVSKDKLLKFKKLALEGNAVTLSHPSRCRCSSCEA